MAGMLHSRLFFGLSSGVLAGFKIYATIRTNRTSQTIKKETGGDYVETQHSGHCDFGDDNTVGKLGRDGSGD